MLPPSSHLSLFSLFTVNAFEGWKERRRGLCWPTPSVFEELELSQELGIHLAGVQPLLPPRGQFSKAENPIAGLAVSLQHPKSCLNQCSTLTSG